MKKPTKQMRTETRQAVRELMAATGWTEEQVKIEAVWALHGRVVHPSFDGDAYWPASDAVPLPRGRRKVA